MRRVLEFYLLFLASFLRLAQTTSEEYPAVRAAAIVSTAEFANLMTVLLAAMMTESLDIRMTEDRLIPLLVIFFVVMYAHHIVIESNDKLKDIIISRKGMYMDKLLAAIYWLVSFSVFFGLLYISL